MNDTVQGPANSGPAKPAGEGKAPQAQGKPQGQQAKPQGHPPKPQGKQGQQAKPQGQQPKPQGQQPKRQGQQPKPQGQQAQPQEQPAQPKWTPPPIRQPAKAAHMKRRHWGLILTFVFLVLLPVSGSAYYLWGIAKDQYSSVTGFTVRKEETGGASELLGGLAQITGSSVSADGDILYEFILSQTMVRKVEENVGIVAHYSQYWDEDPAFSLWPDASIEDLEWFWERIVRIAFDRGSGLMNVRVLAFDPEKAQAIATEIVRQSQIVINQLNSRAREDAMRYALVDLEEAVTRLKTARAALTDFRTRTQIVDPQADLQGRMGVMNNLQQQLAEALIELDLLRDTTNTSDPRLTQAQRRIEVIQERIAEERRSFASDTTENGVIGEDYPTLIAEFEGLTVDREYAEQSYRAALAALDVARAQASRQSRYLATYVEPTLAEASEYPKRAVIFGLIALFLTLGWAIMVLVYYSIRDRS